MHKANNNGFKKKIFNRLRILDVSDNASLHTKEILSWLSSHTTLQSLSLFVNSPPNHSRNPIQHPKYRQSVLNALLLRNPRLVILDRVIVYINMIITQEQAPIILGERVEALNATETNKSSVESYRFNLALNITLVPLKDRKYLPAEGTQQLLLLQ